MIEGAGMAPAASNAGGYSDNVIVWRRIPPWHFQPLENGGKRPSTAAFDDDPDGSSMSVDVDEGQGWMGTLQGHDGFGLVELTVGYLRSLGFDVVPKAVEGNPHHAEVVGKKTDGKKRKMMKSARWVFVP